MGAEFDQNTCTRELILTSLGYQLGRKSKPGLIPSISEVSQGALGRTGQKILSMAPPRGSPWGQKCFPKEACKSICEENLLGSVDISADSTAGCQKHDKNNKNTWSKDFLYMHTTL